jgi:hypothetical protein
MTAPAAAPRRRPRARGGRSFRADALRPHHLAEHAVLARDCLRETPPPRLAVVHASVGTRPIARRGVPPPRPAVSSGRVCRISAPRCRRRRARCPRLPTPLAITEPPAPVDYGCSIRGRHDCFGRRAAERRSPPSGCFPECHAGKRTSCFRPPPVTTALRPYRTLKAAAHPTQERTSYRSALLAETGGKKTLRSTSTPVCSDPARRWKPRADVLWALGSRATRAWGYHCSPIVTTASAAGCLGPSAAAYVPALCGRRPSSRVI